MSHRIVQVRRGVAALTKSALLVLGVPFVLARLWSLATSTHRGDLQSSSLLLFSHGVIAVVAILWLIASCRLLRELVIALRGGNEVPSSWSGRWAGAIASLLVLSGALSIASQRSLAGRAAPRAPSVTAIASSPVSSVPTTLVRPGECLSDVAARTFGDPRAWSELARLNKDLRQNDGRRFVDPSLVPSGWCLVLPRTPSRVEAPMPTAKPQESSPATTRARAEHHEASTNTTTNLLAMELLGLGAITTCALARRLRVLRRRRECERLPGERVRAVNRAPRGLTRELDEHANATLVDWLEQSNHALAGLVAQRPGLSPSIRLVRAGPTGVDFLLEEPIEPPPGVTSVDEGRTWQIRLDDQGDKTTHSGRYAPWLVPIGEDCENAYLAAVGPGTMLSVCGDPTSVDGVLSAITMGLRAVPWAEELGVELFGVEAPGDLERCYQLNRSSVEALRSLAEEAPRPSRGGSGPKWRREPLVVIARARADELDDTLLDELRKRVGVIIAGDAPHPLSTTRLFVADRRGVLEPDGLSLIVAQPDPRQLSIVEALFDQASTRPELIDLADLRRAPRQSAPALAMQHDAPVSMNSSAHKGSVEKTRRDGRLEARGTLELSLLCRRPSLVAIREPLADLGLDRVIELLAYLHLHGHSARRADLERALFSHRQTSTLKGQLDNVIALARRLLDQQLPGTASIVTGHDMVTLSAMLSCDWTRFCHAVAAAKHEAPAIAIGLLDAGLGLVQGPPLIDLPPGYDWLVEDQLRELIIAEIVDASHHLFNLAVAGRQPDLARSAIDRGRAIEPGSEILARDLMVYYDTIGEPAKIERVFDELEALLYELGTNEPSQETRALYAVLTRPPR